MEKDNGRRGSDLERPNNLLFQRGHFNISRKNQHITIPTAAEAIDRLLSRALALCLAGRAYSQTIELARLWVLLEEVA